MDQPDVSLHDHARAAAAIAGALYRYHEAKNQLDDAAAIKDKKAKKFRLIAGDLSGIQHSLFLLASQQVKGVNRILRARSFLMGLLMESAALEVRERLHLDAFATLQMAGGRFLILTGDVPGVEVEVAGARSAIERFMYERYLGELALNVAVSEPFEGELFLNDHFGQALSLASIAVEEWKQKPFSTCLTPVMRNARYPHGVCTACGVRPAASPRPEAPEDPPRCRTCEDERRLGGDLPNLVQWSWSREPGERGRTLKLWGDLWLRWHTAPMLMNHTVLGAARLPADDWNPQGHGAVRAVANYIPRLSATDNAEGRYDRLSEEARAAAPGEPKTFEHLAADALEMGDDQSWVGQPLLAVVKADVDRLGAIFRQGIENPGLGRFAGLSRMMDFFFTAQLPEMIRREFPGMYTVYAGGDDLLLLGPWQMALRFVLRLRAEFDAWVGGNPDVTLSAAVEFIKPEEPLNRAVIRAERRLDAAKNGGRNKVSAVDGGVHPWPEFAGQLMQADQVYQLIRDGVVGQSFLYRLLELDASRCRMEPSGENGKTGSQSADANWRAKWGYQLARNILNREKTLGLEKVQESAEILSGLLGLTARLEKRNAPPARTPVTVALYRTRKTQSERR